MSCTPQAVRPQAVRLAPAVLAARERLEAARVRLREEHRAGTPGIQLCAQLTELLDNVLLDLLESAQQRLGDDFQGLVTLVPHGGYGRRDTAPYSDVDLMLLHAPGSSERVAPLARMLSQDIVDAGLQLGFSVRTPAQAISLALKDATVFTSLVESRYLVGSVSLYRGFVTVLRRRTRGRWRSLIAAIEASRRSERLKFGETVYLLCPNIKRSRGGLRDLQLLRWVGFARYGETEPENLARIGVLDREDFRVIQRSREFLLRLRNELHFQGSRTQDVLDRDEQQRIGELGGYPDSDSLSPVQLFMKDYFDHTSQVWYTVANFVDAAKERWRASRALESLFSHQVERDFRAGPLHIGATRRGLTKIQGDLSQVLRLMDLANLYNKRIDHRTWKAIRTTMRSLPSVELTPETTRRFLDLLARPGRLANLLRRLHELRVLEKIVTPLQHARCLMQFNAYHKYTVDEHTLRAIEEATLLLHQEGPVGEAYRRLHNKQVLHLAILLHDLGKGYTEDHSEVGLQIADQVARDFQLSPHDSETVKFLVHKHLLMSHLALRHDLRDEGLIVRFAMEVGAPDVLQMLYVMTCADLAAVGPGVLNSWKLELLTELYERTWRRLTGEAPPGVGNRPVTVRRQQLRARIVGKSDGGWWERHLRALPSAFLLADDVDEVVDQLETIHRLPADQILASARYIPQRAAVEYTVCAHESVRPGIFHRLTGVLTSSGNQILSAEIHTLADDLVLDRFYVHDLDHAGEPPPERFDEVCHRMQATLKDPTEELPAFRQTWRRPEPAQTPLESLPTRVRFDNDTSANHTIITIFAYDCVGLLYAITRTLYDLQLSVHVAKIGTYLDQVVDVFYVRDAAGARVIDPQRLDQIQKRLLDAIQQVQGR